MIIAAIVTLMANVFLYCHVVLTIYMIFVSIIQLNLLL